jgi:hypothetical protein
MLIIEFAKFKREGQVPWHLLTLYHLCLFFFSLQDICGLLISAGKICGPLNKVKKDAGLLPCTHQRASRQARELKDPQECHCAQVK